MIAGLTMDDVQKLAPRHRIQPGGGFIQD